MLHDGFGVRKQIRTKQACEPVELVGSEMQSVCAAVVGKEVGLEGRCSVSAGLEGRCSLSAGLEGRYSALLVQTVLLCLLLGASTAGTSVFGDDNVLQDYRAKLSKLDLDIYNTNG